MKSDREGVAIFSGARFDFALNCRRFGNAAPRFPGEERHPSRWAQLAVFKTFEVRVKRLPCVLEPHAFYSFDAQCCLKLALDSVLDRRTTQTSSLQARE
jgi:hypothetical protein